MNNYYAQNSQVFFHVTYRIQAKFGGFDHGFNSQECPCLFTYPQDLWIEIIMSVLCLPLYLYGKIYASGKCFQKPRPLLSFYSFYCLIVSYIYSMDFNNFQPAFLFLVLLTLALELFSTAPLLISHLLSLCDSEFSMPWVWEGVDLVQERKHICCYATEEHGTHP